MLDRIKDLSRVAHDLIFDDRSQSLCARAWEKAEGSTFWRMWVCVFGRQHCRRSWEWYNERQPK